MVQQSSLVTGTVTYLPRIALPPNALIEVSLADVSRADAPARILARQTIESNGRQVPFAFALPYDPAQIDSRYTYAVQARIAVDGQLRFINTTRTSVITNGSPTEGIEIVVDPVQR
ncbi:MAG TPA: YbaY family lipoprotein [Thermoleptolyngbya sp. M55_K2018_002]|nr:YbaY family lipoprotein [Thermoleptolyngbya sp. M55_K2018_002]